ncbi:Dynamin family protein [Thiothrix caldifontis]|uniref:Dynamin family protein n=1 Tax=Thiothrix caldifontis TaxID=525918 RepID=A0A1H4BEJ5_9GAMM|nr:dynamin family protein [Thiothrix caldifontis]SEA46232.1 Dynamin family protein [Thiothrix caldifontis]
MKNEIIEKVSPQLEEMAKFLKFGRKKLKNDILSSLGDFNEMYSSLSEERSNLKKYAVKLKFVKGNLENENFEIKNSLRIKEQQLEKVSSKYKSLESNYLSVRDRYKKENHEFKKRLSHKENEYASLKRKYDIIRLVLSAEFIENESLNRFYELFDDGFINFADMEGVVEELKLIASFPEIYNKRIIAIGGGFSSGKSAFINALSQRGNVNLPTGIDPVTAIPTYIISGDGESIKGYTNGGGFFSVDKDLYKILSHEFIKSFGFNLKNIMPFMVVETKFKNIENICFIDTPGYNPSITDGFTNEDKNTASEYLDTASALIWMIGLDSVGTIPASDVKFLEELDLENKKLYVIANKADLRSMSDLESILDEIEESLDDYNIQFDGISAFSAKDQKEYVYRGLSLNEFLSAKNENIDSRLRIKSEINKVFDIYAHNIKIEIESIKDFVSKFKSLELDILQAGYDLEETGFFDTLAEMKNSFSTTALEQQHYDMKQIRATMLSVIDDMFDGFLVKG